MRNQTNIGFMIECGMQEVYLRYDDWYGVNMDVSLTTGIIVTGAGLTANALLIHVLNKHSHFNVPCFWLVKASCVTDLFVALRSMVYLVSNYVMGYYEKVPCNYYKFMIWVLYMTQLVSAFIVGFLSIDKFVAVVLPFVYTNYILAYPKLYKIILAAAVFVLFVFSVTTVVAENFSAFLAGTGGLHVIIFVLTIPIYVSIYREFRRVRAADVARLGKEFADKVGGSGNQRGVVTCMYVGSLYLFFLPTLVLQQYMSYYESVSEVLFACLTWAFLISTSKCVVNPVVFVATLPNLREKVWEFVQSNTTLLNSVKRSSEPQQEHSEARGIDREMQHNGENIVAEESNSENKPNKEYVVAFEKRKIPRQYEVAEPESIIEEKQEENDELRKNETASCDLDVNDSEWTFKCRIIEVSSCENGSSKANRYELLVWYCRFFVWLTWLLCSAFSFFYLLVDRFIFIHSWESGWFSFVQVCSS